MLNFDEIFASTTKRPVKYKNKNIVRKDDIPFEDGDRFLISFEKTASEWTQGIELYLFGSIEIENLNVIVNNRTVFWETTAPKQVTIKLWQDLSKRPQPKKLPRKGLLGIKNIWDCGDNVTHSWVGGAAMIVEEIENGKRYRCNDGHLDDDFDDIIFTITRLPPVDEKDS